MCTYTEFTNFNSVDYMLNHEWFINADIKCIKIDSTVMFQDSMFGNVEVNADIDLIVVGLGFGKYF
jgi:outer membrane protein W